MEASMHGFGTQSAAGAAPTWTRRAARNRSAARQAKGSARRRAEHKDSPAGIARLEHALFALVLGCVGYVWLGALLGEAAQAL